MDRRGNVTTHAYDGANNRTGTVNALLETSTFDYDSQHRLERVTDALGHFSEFDYDAENHLIASRDGEGNEATTSYRADGLTSAETNPRTITTAYSYDGNGYPASSQIGSPPAISTDYDALGRLVSLTDQAGAQTAFVYDDRGLVVERTDPLGRSTTSVYDDLGRLTSQTDRNGDTVTTSYTGSGKLDTITRPGESVAFDYDSRDNLVTMTDTLGTTTNTHDALNRLTSTTDPNGFVVQYAYDEAGNLTTLTYPGGNTVSCTYDALNRVASVRIDWLNVTATPSYDDAGRLTGIGHFNGTATVYGYDDADRLTGLTHTAGGVAIADYQYTLDPNGNRTQVVVDAEPALPASLINASEPRTYNTFKNRLTDATLDGTPVSFSYDDEGQLQAKGGTAFTFDSANRLTGFGVSSYQYDGVGNRLAATRNGVATQYIYDAAGNLLAEADGTGTITRYYIHGLGLLAMVDAQTDEVYVYHHDGTGHTVAMTDDTQNVVNRYAYSPYGEILGRDETVSQPFTYVGQYGVMTEPEGLYYMRARYYDAEVGRFISEDPAGLIGGLNAYSYAGGNPVIHIDPDGEAFFLAPAVVGGLIGAGVNAVATVVANGGDVTTRQVLSAALNGAIAGAVGAYAGPIGGTAAKGLGRSATGVAAKVFTTAVAGAGAATGQALANATDSENRSSVLAAAAFGGAGGAVASLIPVKGVSTLNQARFFGPRTLSGMFKTNNARTITGSFGVSAGIGAGAVLAK